MATNNTLQKDLHGMKVYHDRQSGSVFVNFNDLKARVNTRGHYETNSGSRGRRKTKSVKSHTAMISLATANLGMA